MDRIKDLEKYQKIILLFMAAMVLVYTVLYVITVQREGYAYKDGILIPKQENEATIYSGKVWGERAVFTVSLDKIVEFRYGDKTYVPYTVKEDATAIPDDDMVEDALGVEICCGEEVIFRGGGICILTASSILFADEIFRWNLSWQIRNADRAEPTEWELEMRKVAWVVYPIIAMLVFGVGLR